MKFLELIVGTTLLALFRIETFQKLGAVTFSRGLRPSSVYLTKEIRDLSDPGELGEAKGIKDKASHHLVEYGNRFLLLLLPTAPPPHLTSQAR
jgi:hypothetical protein